MSAIFPDSPAKLKIHLLPTKAEFFSYYLNWEDTLSISAWMPDGYYEVKNSESQSTLAYKFFSNHCDRCRRNCFSYFEENEKVDFVDSFGRINWDKLATFKSENQDECLVYFDGFDGERTCPEGHVFNGDSVESISCANTVFEIKLSYKGDAPRFQVWKDNAQLKAGKLVKRDGKTLVYETDGFGTLNVFSSETMDYDEHLWGSICWGSYDAPQDLRSIVATYVSSNSNDDLLTNDEFEENIDCVRGLVRRDSYHQSEQTFLSDDCDAVALIDADQDVQAFYTFLTAGFTPIAKAPHIMMVPLKTSTIKRGEMTYFGYTTAPDKVGRRWYVSTEGYLVGQMDNTFVTA